MRYPERPIFTFLAAVLVLIPLPWHWRARNIATVSLITWLFVVNVIYCINSIIWAGNVRNIAPAWCDITTKIVIGASHALPTSTMCICKHLEAVSSTRKIAFDHFGRIRRIAFESVICFGVPVLLMGHCTILALNNFIQRRIIFASHIQKSDSALTPNRYLRLISMAVTTMVYATFCACYTLYNNISSELAPWTTWDDVHADWLRVDTWPEFLIPPGVLKSMLIVWWAMPVSDFIFFLFFGFGEEAVKANLKAYQFVMHAILRKRSSEKNRVQVPVESNVGQPLLCKEPRSNLTPQ
ncbi:Pheromone B beta 1 receptor [Leucoagaricus sp. SymC.cos]|nr:Pheromone B beta 1 receptor [Leucoagaricus sp. SymC.cos]